MVKRLVTPLKNKKIAGVYGRQELCLIQAILTRDLLLLFGQDKISNKSFFSQLNSAFLRKTWNKNKFDEKASNIEDRIWGSR